ncbi:MAG: ABC transporter substrate-binding protein, partial [Chloroflexi bacterium]|nr:ABC transporter substrate-binding protein [Chloroflexota bacterium]
MASSCAQDRPTRQASPGADGQAAAQAGGNFRFGQSGDITVLDPWNVTDGNSLLVTRQIFESLVAYEPTGFKIVPKLATKWEPSGDGRTWTFTLRDDVKFHDGTHLTAEAVVFNFERGRTTKHPQRGKPVGD